MTRWTLAVFAVMLVGLTLVVAAARLFGGSGSRLSLIVSVASAWLGAWVLWSFAGGLALHYGALSTYDAPVFGVLALVAGVVQYRARLERGREPALAVFIGGQLVWIAIVLVRNGIVSGR
ncbi:MAG: hypothetical protein HY294_01450 [Candidatus Rokubacteria bacterium]|nr:hypothetical protein [Candidatus Rokubacteria bacterium]MBI3824646.1 hypothetical protein [Candidatus Rokubacteria bacterium]